MNVTYEFYKNSFGGSLIPESRWKSLEIKMSARINRYTFNRMREGEWPIQAKTALSEIDALEEHVDNLTEANKSREAENAELIATVDSILTDVLPTLLGDGTEETQ